VKEGEHMRRINAHMEMSLDGVVEHPENWAHQYFTPQMAEATTKDMPRAGEILFGRRTYEEFARVWPQRDPDENPYVVFLNESQKLVVSSTPIELPWGPAERIESTEAVAELKEKPGGDLLVLGSPTLVGSLLRAGLLDQLEVFVVPTVIGTGQRLFEADEPVRLRLTESRAFDNGVLLTRYAPEAKE
jgi:dihydrofolate reductase